MMIIMWIVDWIQMLLESFSARSRAHMRVVKLICRFCWNGFALVRLDCARHVLVLDVICCCHCTHILKVEFWSNYHRSTLKSSILRHAKILRNKSAFPNFHCAQDRWWWRQVSSFQWQSERHKSANSCQAATRERSWNRNRKLKLHRSRDFISAWSWDMTWCFFSFFSLSLFILVRLRDTLEQFRNWTPW